MTPALVFWAANGVLAYLIGIRLSFGFGRLVSIFGAAVLLSLSMIVVVHQPLLVWANANLRLSRDQVGIAMILGVRDDDALQKIFPYTSVPWGAREFLRQNRLSMFSEPFSEWIGLNIRDKFDLAHKNRCIGFFDGLTRINSTESTTILTQGHVAGWVWDKELTSVPQTIVVANEVGVIVGLGSSGYQRKDVSQGMAIINAVDSGWQGYVDIKAGSFLRAYAVLNGGKMI